MTMKLVVMKSKIMTVKSEKMIKITFIFKFWSNVTIVIIMIEIMITSTTIINKIFLRK